MHWKQHLVDAEVDINRAMFELNRGEEESDPNYVRDLSYIKACAKNAAQNLQAVNRKLARLCKVLKR